MPYKYWLSPFTIEPSFQSTLNNAGLVQQTWKQIDLLPANDILLLFNPPDLVLTQVDQRSNQELSNKHNVSHISNLYQTVLKQAQARSIPLIAAWQLQLTSQTIALRELFSLDPAHYSALRQDSIDWPSIEPIAALAVWQLDQEVNGNLTNMYIEIDQLAMKFGRPSDSRYSERLKENLSEQAVVRIIQDYKAIRQREALMLESLHKTQSDYRDYVLETQAIIKNYQQLLDESQHIAGHYRDEIVKMNQDLTST